jgi:hypothetical protein
LLSIPNKTRRICNRSIFLDDECSENKESYAKIT